MLSIKKSSLTRIVITCIMAAILCVCAFADENVVYVSDGASGTGTSALDPVGTITDAYNALGTEGGTVVVCGTYTITEQLVVPSHTGKVTVTSVYGGTDYTVTSGAVIDLYANLVLSGPTEFNNIKICCRANTPNSYTYSGILGRANNVVLGDGIICDKDENSNTYPSFIGGSSAVYNNKTATVVINSGTWQRVRGGANKGGASNYNVNITFNGGTYLEKLILASCAVTGDNSHAGNINATVNGGTFYGGICLTSFLSDSDVYSGNAAVTVNGGKIYGPLSVAYSKIGIYNGKYTLEINGGEFAHVTEICGADALGGSMKSTITYSEDIELDAAETGKITFTNYLRRNNPDPFMFTYDGNYYYTATGNTTVSLIQTANISDIKDVPARVILSPENYTDLWSPEIHYFSADEVGAANEGWYMFVGAKEKDASGSVASNQRQYVVKCLDGDNLLGSWGDPVTGEKNVLRKMTFSVGGYNEDSLCGGTSVIRINGQAYLTFVSEKGRGTSAFHQTINITTFENPWTITGTPVEICRPDYDWEKGGYGSGYNDEGEFVWWPQVVEGASAVYSPTTDDIYLMYTGSGYWTVDYALGYLSFLGGDPLDAANWKKCPYPVLRRENTLTESTVNGSGHGSYFTDTDGQMWVAYHGYIGVDTSSKRFSFVEPIFASEYGVYIGNATGNPAPIDTEYEVNVNPKSIAQKLSGFDVFTVNHNNDINSGVKLRFNPIDDATIYVVRRDGKQIYSGQALSYVDAEATPGAHTYLVQALKRGTVLSSATFSEVARNNLRFKDVNGDGVFSVVDMLTVLVDFLDYNENESTLRDIIQMLKCI